MSAEMWATLTAGPVMSAVATVTCAAIASIGTIWLSRRKDATEREKEREQLAQDTKNDSQQVTAAAVRDIYGMGERQRRDLEKDNIRLRERVDKQDTMTRELIEKLAELKGAFEFLQRMRCPLAEKGECPVFMPANAGTQGTRPV